MGLGSSPRGRGILKPSIDIARVIENLIDGDFTDIDRMLYNHEVYESTLMADGFDYNEAHEKANELYPWSIVLYGIG